MDMGNRFNGNGGAVEPTVIEEAPANSQESLDRAANIRAQTLGEEPVADSWLPSARRQVPQPQPQPQPQRYPIRRHAESRVPPQDFYYVDQPPEPEPAGLGFKHVLFAIGAGALVGAVATWMVTRKGKK